jgi:branched-chain amino acid transport system permease protein
LTIYLSKTFTGPRDQGGGAGRAGAAPDGANPVAIKQWAFGIATGVSALAGAMLIIVGPVEPAMDRVYIGRTFCVVVLAGSAA